ncbi:MAG: integrase arm-type DNA-binding domain-containing protein [Cognatishimia sp.]
MPIKKRTIKRPINETLKLTENVIKNLPPWTKDYFVKDADFPKLQLKITPKGAKSFIVRYRNLEGRERKLKLGDYPTLSASAARIRAMKAAAEIADGGDPVQEKKNARGGTTFTDFADYFMSTYAELHLRETTLRGYRQILNSILLPAFGTKPIHRISPEDVRDLQLKKKIPSTCPIARLGCFEIFLILQRKTATFLLAPTRPKTYRSSKKTLDTGCLVKKSWQLSVEQYCI